MPINFDLLQESGMQVAYFQGDRHSATIDAMNALGVTEGDFEIELLGDRDTDALTDADFEALADPEPDSDNDAEREPLADEL
jgi:hypothetical protein